MRTLIISDIHGSYYTMKKLLDEANFDEKNDKLICLGDMCDRGKNTKLVWEFFYNLQKNYKHHIVLLGNHEDMFNLAVNEAVYSKGNIRRQAHAFRNGSLSTLQSFYADANEEDRTHFYKKFAKEYKDLRKWLKKLSTRYESADYYFVHAGVDFEKNFWNQSHRDMIWIREPFLSSKESYDKKVFHGHTPQISSPNYDIKENRINIDGGCVYGGKLNLVIIENEQLLFKQSGIEKEDVYKIYKEDE